MHTAESLQTLLHDTLSLSLKTLQFHWNVIGPNFGPLHDLFGSQYKSLSEAADTLAERLRALQTIVHPFTSTETFSIEPIPIKSPKPTKMLEILTLDHEKLAAFSSEAAKSCAAEDPASSNLFADRQSFHEKTAWMLRSHLQ